jgi:hypothetical protein
MCRVGEELAYTIRSKMSVTAMGAPGSGVSGMGKDAGNSCKKSISASTQK